jgi:hypothetical protein
LPWFPTLLGRLIQDRLLDADIVCARAKNHYDPYAEVQDADGNLDSHKAAFKPLHKGVENLMYFSVSASDY